MSGAPGPECWACGALAGAGPCLACGEPHPLRDERDPMAVDVTLRRLIDACAAGNRSAAAAALEALDRWHDRGRPVPRWPATAPIPVGLAAFHLGFLCAVLDSIAGNRLRATAATAASAAP